MINRVQIATGVFCLTLASFFPLSTMAVCPAEDIIDQFRSMQYFRDIRPQYHQGVPTDVQVSVYVETVSAVSEVNMEYTVDIYLRQTWVDPRLAFDLCDDYIALNSDWLDVIWLPDTFFLDSKSELFHSVTVPNVALRIFPNGTVYYSQRLSLTLGCVMELFKFPLDVQYCEALIMSYGQTSEELHMTWREIDDPVEINSGVRLPQTEICTTRHGHCWKTYAKRNYSCVFAEFRLQRLNGFYVIQIYVPGALIVMLSWVSFWLDRRATPARVSLGLLCVLTTTTHTTGVNSSLPRVSYIKAMDVWNFTCLVFVFSALLEFALINVKIREEEAVADRNIHNKTPNQSNESRQWEPSCVSKVRDSARGLEVKGRAVQKPLYWSADRLDKTCRFLFPAAFLLFNVIYWSYYKLS